MADGEMDDTERAILEGIVGKIRRGKLRDGTVGWQHLTCPKCSDEMKLVEFQGVNVDRCMHCGGIWFDQSELNKIDQLDGSEKLDTRARFAQVTNEARDLVCPRCQRPMTAVRSPRKQELVFEQCSGGCGLFLDAGELTELKCADVQAVVSSGNPQE